MTKHYYTKGLDIPQDADSVRYHIPEGYTAKIEDGAFILVPKESEDEKTRKELLEVIRHCYKDGGYALCTDDYKKYSAYLEKQKAQKPAEKQDYSCLNNLERAIHRGFLSAGVENVQVTIIKETAQECLSQTKPELSEEEKHKLNRIYAILGQSADTHAFSTTCRLIGDKEAVELQDFPRSIAKPQIPEWSAEDEKILVAISKALGCDTAEKILVNEGVTLVMAAGFLESLKNRGNFPQSNTNSPSWKPSEEQMRCLRGVVQDVNKKSLMSTTGYSPAAVLQSLYIDLKALM